MSGCRPGPAQLANLAVLGVFLLTACGEGDAPGTQADEARGAVAVTVAEARRQEVRIELYSVGRLVSRNAPQLAAEIDALQEDEQINDELKRLKAELGEKRDEQ